MVYFHMKMSNLNAEDVEVTPQRRRNMKGVRQKYISYLDAKKMARL